MINYKKVIENKFHRVHQSLGYFMISFTMDEELETVFIHPCNDLFEPDEDVALCTFDYIKNKVEIFEEMDIELASYLVNEIFYEIYKEIKNIKQYLISRSK